MIQNVEKCILLSIKVLFKYLTREITMLYSRCRMYVYLINDYVITIHSDHGYCVKFEFNDVSLYTKTISNRDVLYYFLGSLLCMTVLVY